MSNTAWYDTHMVSVVIPYYNESSVIADCFLSLLTQSYTNFEIIFVDDASTDDSTERIKAIKNSKQILQNILFLSQPHEGPAKARNLGVHAATGEIIVFVDADMTFDPFYIEKLIEPIIKGNAKGTFTKEEYVSNWEKVYARCWNYNEGISTNKRVPDDYPDTSPVFRAIQKTEFERVGGFDPIGFTDDWTLSRKLGYKAVSSSGAICYHKNPETLRDIYNQARWIGKNEFISGTFIRRIVNLVRYNEVIQLIRGLNIVIRHKEPYFLLFQLVYYFGIYVSIIKSFAGESKNK